MRYIDTSVLIAYMTRETGSTAAQSFMQRLSAGFSSTTRLEIGLTSS